MWWMRSLLCVVSFRFNVQLVYLKWLEFYGVEFVLNGWNLNVTGMSFY